MNISVQIKNLIKASVISTGYFQWTIFKDKSLGVHKPWAFLQVSVKAVAVVVWQEKRMTAAVIVTVTLIPGRLQFY